MDTFNEDYLKLKYEEYRLKKEIKTRRYKRNGTTANKDSSKTKVYRVEWEFEKVLKDNSDWRAFADIEECQKYINQVLKTKKWKSLSRSGSKINAERMKDMKNGATAGKAWYGLVRLSPSTGFNQYVVLHELAHCAGHMHHDVSFRNCLVELVSCFIGREYGKTLKRMFKEGGLKMSVSNKILPYEKWVKNYLKMETLRMKRAKS